MASLLVCLPSSSELRGLALTYDCVQKMRRWRRLEGGMTELHDVVSTLGCVNYRALQSSELEDLLKLLALHFEEALMAIRRRSVSPSEADFGTPFSRAEESDVKPYVDDDLKPDDLTDNLDPSSTTDFENKDAPKHLPQNISHRTNIRPTLANLEYGHEEHVRGLQQKRKLENNYACSVCPKTFTVAKSLYRHEKRTHGSHGKANDEADKDFSAIPKAKESELEGASESLIEAPQSPPEAGTKAFKNDGSPPQRTEKNKSCRVCSKKFASASSAERHEKRVHRERKDRPEKDDAEISAKTVATEGGTKDCNSKEPTTLDSLVQSLNLPVEEYVAEGYGSESRVRGDDAIEATVVTTFMESGVAKMDDKNVRSADLGATGVSIETTPTKNLCPICGVQFPTLADLQQHEAEAHEELGSGNKSRMRKRRCRRFFDESKTTKVFECNHCGKQFKDKHYLRKHDNVHTRSKLYVCHLCGKSFNQNSGLYTHKKLHLDNAPFKCDVEGCGKSFTTKNSLISHTSEHTGIRPFICEGTDGLVLWLIISKGIC